MFLLPVVVIAAAAYVAFRALHRGTPLASSGISHPAAATVARPALWPTTIEGKVGVAAFALGFLPIALVNVVQVAFFGWAVQIVALASTAVARFVRHDRAASVLIVFILSAVVVLASMLFLAGEVIVGHD